MGLSARNKLAFPTGFAPGFNPNHISIGTTGLVRLSCVCMGNANMVSIMSGQIGTLTGTPTFAMHKTIGPSLVTSSGGASAAFSPGPSTTDTNYTIACIFYITSQGSFNILCLNNNGPSPDFFVDSTSPFNLRLQASGNTLSSIPVSLNTPYFCAVSNSGSTTANFLLLNLATGAVQTQSTTGAGTSSTFNSTIIVAGVSSFGQQLNGGMAACAYIANSFLSLPQLLEWAADPWAFWYPDEDATYVGTTPVATGPAHQYDWTNPVQPFRMEETWVQRLQIPQPVGGPFNQFDWPNPVPPYRLDETWINANLLKINQPPIRQYDWPNPRDYLRIEETWIQSPRPQLAGIPGYQHDWPNPYPVTWYQNYQQWFNPPQPVGGPFNEYDWPNPQPIVYYKSWELNLLETTLGIIPKPFSQTDWPVPVYPYRPEYTWTQSLRLPQPIGGPFNQLDWPNPKIAQPIEQTWLWNLQEFVIVPPMPHNQYDWPVPRGYAPIDQFWSQVFEKFSAIPFSQLDWKNPQQYIPILQSWINNLPPGVIGTITSPFNQYDWPVPKASSPIDQYWAVNTSLLPVPPPIPTGITTGGRQVEEWEVEQYLTAANEYYKKVINAYNTQTAQDVSKIAAELGKRGGEARAKALTSTQRSNIATKAAQIRWK